MEYSDLLDRQEIITRIEEELQSKVITFYRNCNHPSGIITEKSYDDFRRALGYVNELEPLVVIIDSQGGYFYWGWRIASCILNRTGLTTAIIPEEALSAASMITLTADNIVMFDQISQLSPVDPQYDHEGQLVSALDLLHSEDPVTRSSAQSAIDQAERFLNQLCGPKLSGEELNTLVERFLLKDRVHADHNSSIFPTELIELGLPIEIESNINIRALHECYQRHVFNENGPETIVEYLRGPIPRKQT